MMLGERIANARKAKGWAQEELAQRLGVTLDSIVRWETEQLTPRANKLVKLSGVLGVPIMWLVAGAEQPPEIGSFQIGRFAHLENKLDMAEEKIQELSKIIDSIRLELNITQIK